MVTSEKLKLGALTSPLQLWSRPTQDPAWNWCDWLDGNNTGSQLKRTVTADWHNFWQHIRSHLQSQVKSCLLMVLRFLISSVYMSHLMTRTFFFVWETKLCWFILDVEYNFDGFLCLHWLLSVEDFQKQHGGIQSSSDAKLKITLARRRRRNLSFQMHGNAFIT